MLDVNFLPSLPPSDIERAAQLILRAYGAPNPNTSTEDLRRFQQELYDIQKLPEAWGLVLPLLNHQDQNVQFFGAHTAAFPEEHEESLKNLLVQLTSHSVAIGRARIIIRKLFVALTALALKLVPQHPTHWPDWILNCITSLSGNGASKEYLHEFLSIVSEEIGSADLLGDKKPRMQQTLLDAAPMVVQAVRSSIDRPSATAPNEILSALKCLQAWLPHLPASDITPLIPLLITLLNPDADTVFVASSESLQEITTKSALSDGSGSKTLTEPLLFWLDTIGHRIVENAVQSGITDEVAVSLCKLLSALGDHSISYLAANMASSAPVTLLPSATAGIPQNMLDNKTKGQLTQTFLRLLLRFTGFPGYYGVDEEVSETTLGFWYMLQEALWDNSEMGDQAAVAKALYVELVKLLRDKIRFPGPGHGWSKDQVEKFSVYRRDVGDILINAYYVIRDDMIQFFIDDAAARLAARQPGQQGGWEDIEATLHCILSIQEALDYENTPHLHRLFSTEILGRLPTTGYNRVRRTTLSLIGTYASWFATSNTVTTPPKQDLLMTCVSYVVQALPVQTLCLQAASALRNLCDANRKALAPQIGAFAELHAGLAQVPDSEKSKVMESIASVIQALPPMEEIPPVEVIVNPIIQKMGELIRSPNTLPAEARASAILQLETLAGVAKGLTRAGGLGDGVVLAFEEDSEDEAEVEAVEQARQDPRMINLRQSILDSVRGCVEVFGEDAGIGQALNELVKSITSLPTDATLITLPPPPLLEIVCFAMQRQVTASWLTLAGILIHQLSPPPPMPLADEHPKAQKHAKIREERDRQAKVVVSGALPILLSTSLTLMGSPNGMENVSVNPDIVQEFFSCMDRAAQFFTSNFYSLPSGALDALMNCTVRALTLQERYSLVSASSFLSTFIHRSYVHSSLETYRLQMLAVHGRTITYGVLSGLAGQAPRSAMPNLIEVLSTLLTRCVEESRKWIKEVLFDASASTCTMSRRVLISTLQPSFPPSKATSEDKEKFMKSVVGSRSLKRTREAAQHFTLIARGLEGTSFGYASVSM
ncbi:ARM repeat-containing protein [Dendrothele bispora CBS 962.96]|uniref:ARM repeat-containing protein n=1 Tax=Dendrothele bispora (strain CBS 962.96) TaxID=1314807 RepID=A0A4S8MGY8_DENBC|nr:ARM repeat-containing protein [Dendrothele bispora CBS 962.96]